MEQHFPIAEVQAHFKAALQRAPKILGNDAINFFLDRFKDQAWLGNTREPWPARKKFTKWGKTPRNNGRALLIDSGRLRRSIRITTATSDEIRIGSNVPYARAHNEGMRLGLIQKVKSFSRKGRNGKVQIVREHTRRINQNIPRRQFMGYSPYLDKQLKRRLQAEMVRGLENIIIS